MDLTSPFNSKNYDFMCKNDINIKEDYIEYGENNINRSENIINIYKFVNNIDDAITLELSIFEASLVYCLNKDISKEYVVPTYNDKINNLYIALEKSDNFKSIIGINKQKNKKELKKRNNETTETDKATNDIETLKPIKKRRLCEIGFLSYEHYFNEQWKPVIDKIEEREQHENNIAYSDAYKCFKCGESKCKISMKQIRSADEPMTTFVKCLVCGNAFKIN